MFDGILKNYDQEKKSMEKENDEIANYFTDRLKKNIKSLGEPLSKEILMNLNSKVIVLHSNQQLIEKETKQLRNECLKFYKEAKNWMAMYDQLNEALKEVGDVVNWANIIENDLRDLVAKRKENNAK